MANRKINLTYLWADESILREDLEKRISSKMTDWANAFYKNYGFELDIEPKLPERATFSGAQKYVLAKNDGVRPDLRDSAVAYAQEYAWLELYDAQSKAAEKAIVSSRIDSRLDDAKARVVALRAQLSRLGQERSAAADPVERQRLDAEIAQGKVTLTAAEAELENAYKEFHTLYRAFTEAMKRWNDLTSYVDIKAQDARGEYKFRSQMAMKYRNDSIGSDTRVNVVFCKFQRAVRGLKMRPGPFGMTFSDLTQLVQSFNDEIYIWGGPFIIVNLGLERTHVIAHEVVHATGRSHPFGLKIYQKKPVRRVARTTIAKGSLGGIPFSDLEIKIEYSTLPYEEVPGGTYDGPANDIMSYALEERDPAATILSERDQRALERAIFVS